ncbi:oxidation resistance protein 1 isoform X4 [Bacillus rossius redtenbacheri]|uniref:oxidation resistance protein 1 isoform X4 n=1 Tax=Bacillus rossius redtenbacheri TaxID=93214 RepID=UPI002FDD38E1
MRPDHSSGLFYVRVGWYARRYTPRFCISPRRECANCAVNKYRDRVKFYRPPLFEGLPTGAWISSSTRGWKMMNMEYNFPIVVDDYDRTQNVEIWETEMNDFVVWYTATDSDGGSRSELTEKKMGKIVPPENTITYTVEPSDTLMSVAARFDTTPSELTKLNRLTTRLVFPGQVLHVPDKSARRGSEEQQQQEQQQQGEPEDEDATTPVAPSVEERDILDSLRPVSPKPFPGHIERVRVSCSSKNSTASSVDGDDHERKHFEGFLKINVHHITDGQGVVGGVLLVTTNAVMFDPNVSDPLVIEHGPESYGVVVPMEFVVNAAIYNDIAHMRVGNSVELPKPDAPKPEIYHAKDSLNAMSDSTDTLLDSTCPTAANAPNSPGKDSLLVKDETFPELAPARSSPEFDNETEDNESVCSCTGRDRRDGDAFPKAFDRDLVTPTNLVQSDSEASTSEQKDSRQVSFESCSSNYQKTDVDGVSKTDSEKSEDLEEVIRIDAERRKSCIDHHWSIPSVDRSLDKETENILTEECKKDAADGSGDETESGSLVKLSCHDSGIDIHEAGVSENVGSQATTSTGDADELDLSSIVPVTKKVFSDADIINGAGFDFVPPLTTAELSTIIAQESTDSSLTSDGSRKKTSSVSFSLDSNQEGEGSVADKDSGGEEGLEKHETRRNKMLKRLSYPLTWMEGLTGGDEKDGLPGLPGMEGTHHSSVFSKVFSRRSSVGTFIRPHPQPSEPKTQTLKAPAPKLDYRSMVSVDDMPELFVSFDKLIPRPACSCKDPLMYLCLRMGKPIDKKVPKSTPVMSYGRKMMRPEYWFSIPKNRVDDLYHFLTEYFPQLYGELDEAELKNRGYELVKNDTELCEDRVLSMKEELRRALDVSSIGGFELPELVGVTEIFTEEHRKKLSRHLPARAEGYVWTLVFSTSQHGFSLNSMYRKMSKVESPILMVIEDTEHNVFGALTSCAMKVSDHFYGTGESLLFRFTPEFQVFPWTGKNMYFIKGNNESLAIGAGDGKFGLWLDGDLYQGRTQPCSTYGNEPLAPQEDFVVKTMECWAFI